MSLPGLGRLASAALGAASRRGLLALRGAVRLAGLAGPVDVHYDELGIPHVRAFGDADALFALGVCHTVDRFFQMDMLRRVLAGRLAETVGERRVGASHPLLGPESTTVDADRLMRQLDLAGAARRTVAAATPEDRALLDAYVRGRERDARAAATAPAARAPAAGTARWRRGAPIDSVLIAKGLALGLNFKWRTAPVLQGLADLLGRATAAARGDPAAVSGRRGPRAGAHGPARDRPGARLPSRTRCPSRAATRSWWGADGSASGVPRARVAIRTWS